MMVVEVLAEVGGLAGHEDVIILQNLGLAQLPVLVGVGLSYQVVGLGLVLIILPGMYPDLSLI